MNIAVIGDNSNSPEIQKIVEILDKKYEPIVIKQDRFKRNLIQMAMMYQGITQRMGPNVDIITEFELIQLKKSKLSKSNRDWVVQEFNKHYKLIE